MLVFNDLSFDIYAPMILTFFSMKTKQINLMVEI